MNSQINSILDRAFSAAPDLSGLNGKTLSQVLVRLCGRFKALGGARIDESQLGERGLLPVFVARAKSQALVLLGEDVAIGLFPNSSHAQDAAAATGVVVRVDDKGAGPEAMLRIILIGVAAQHYLQAASVNRECNVAALVAHYASPVFKQILMGREYEPLHTESEIRSMVVYQALQGGERLGEKNVRLDQ